MNLSTWFDPEITYKKREDIADLIKMKMKEAAPEEELPLLPEISFYKDSEEVDGNNNMTEDVPEQQEEGPSASSGNNGESSSAQVEEMSQDESVIVIIDDSV